MKRAVSLLTAVGALALVGGSARASTNRVILDRFHGPFAEAAWEKTTATSSREADTLISQEQDGTTHLNIHEYTTYLDSSGNVTGSVDISGSLTGAEMAFDTLRLTTAAASGSVPVTRCSFDAVGNPTGCTDGTLSVSEAWAGKGELFQGSFNEDHFVVPGDFVFIDRLNGKFRLATATASIAGDFFDVSDLVFADFGVSNQLTAMMCSHGC
ncbi:MAG TPA: hypothetical protein VJ838_04240 [Gaiellaceae bacterium]|nr:hypothetical protein [Gaiellaceae bacterium]